MYIYTYICTYVCVVCEMVDRRPSVNIRYPNG